MSEGVSSASKSRGKRLTAFVWLSLLGLGISTYSCRMFFLLHSEPRKSNLDLYIVAAVIGVCLFATLLSSSFAALVKWRYVSIVRVKDDGRMHLILEPNGRIVTIRLDGCKLLKKIYMDESRQPTEAIGVSVEDRVIFWLSEAALNDYHRYARIHKRATSS